MIDTDDLIAGLAGEGAAPEPGMSRRFWWPLVVAAVFCAALLIAILGEPFRPMAIYGAGPMAVKWGFSLPLVIVSAIALKCLGRPGLSAKPLLIILSLPFLGNFALLAVDLVNPSGSFPGGTWQRCLLAMAILSPVAFISAIAATRWLAPTDLPMSGLVAGLFGGGLAMTAYAPFCPELGMIYMTVFYVLPVLTMAAVGWIIGPRLLRW